MEGVAREGLERVVEEVLRLAERLAPLVLELVKEEGWVMEIV